MKMTFEQWALILKVMKDRATDLAGTLEIYKRDADADGEDSWTAEQVKRIHEQLEPMQEIINTIQHATL